MENNIKSLKLQLAKGARDLTPTTMIKRQAIIKTLQKNFELYGYNPLETPIIERYDLFASKFSQGNESEAMKETFKLVDQGKRMLVLRNEFTVPLGRFVGMNPNLKMPFKRYQMGPVFRDGPIKLGRYREFWQCDADVVGAKSMLADAESIQLLQSIFNELNMDVEIRINNRKILNGILNLANIPNDSNDSVIITIDKLDRMGLNGVKQELLDKGINKTSVNKILNIVKISGNNEKKIKQLEDILGKNTGIEEIKTMMDYLTNQKNIVLSPFMARGLAYYTGNIFEVYLKNDKLSVSLAGGGRFDRMISGFLQNKKEYPAVGFSLGLETILDVISLDCKKTKNSVVEIFVIPVGEKTIKEAFRIASQLRDSGINADIDLLNRSLTKNLKYANELNIKYVLFIGEEEIKRRIVRLKNMETGEQIKIKKKDLISKLKQLTNKK